MTDKPESDVAMTLWEHLDELRKRILRSLIAFGIATAGSWAYREKLLALLKQPFERAWIGRHLPGPPELQNTSPEGPFVGYMQLSLVGGIILAMPVVFYQLWSFISPGLYQREKRFVVPFVTFSTLLFMSGVAFAYHFGLPLTFDYFFSLLGPIDGGGTVLTMRPTLEYYLDFTTRVLLAFGFVFELPLFISFLVIAGIVTPKQLVRFSRWAVLLAFVAGAIVTPGGEITTQAVVSGALIGLYFLSVVIAFFLRSKKNDVAG